MARSRAVSSGASASRSRTAPWSSGVRCGAAGAVPSRDARARAMRWRCAPGGTCARRCATTAPAVMSVGPPASGTACATRSGHALRGMRPTAASWRTAARGASAACRSIRASPTLLLAATSSAVTSHSSGSEATRRSSGRKTMGGGGGVRPAELAPGFGYSAWY
eukprot:2610754-Prymnesium_polylepis.1